MEGEYRFIAVGTGENEWDEKRETVERARGTREHVLAAYEEARQSGEEGVGFVVLQPNGDVLYAC